MSTPIDQVRELIRYRELRYEARDETRLTTALASVLRDAERYKVLLIVTDDLVRQCAKAISETDRFTPRPLTAEDQARAVLVYLSQRTGEKP